MATKADVMAATLKLMEDGKPLRASNLRRLGYARNTINNALTQLVKDGKITRYGHASGSWYTLAGKELVFKEKSEGIPDLPDNLLFMFGYTRIVPNAGRYVKGVM